VDFLGEAFGGFNPQSDKDAALKFSLDVLLLDNRSLDLLEIVKGGNRFGGVEGVPGWTIERREHGEVLGYENWPEGARFRAYVDPTAYALAYTEFYADTPMFMRYVRAIVAVYEKHHPEYSSTTRQILEVAV